MKGVHIQALRKENKTYELGARRNRPRGRQGAGGAAQRIGGAARADRVNNISCPRPGMQHIPSCWKIAPGWKSRGLVPCSARRPPRSRWRVGSPWRPVGGVAALREAVGNRCGRSCEAPGRHWPALGCPCAPLENAVQTVGHFWKGRPVGRHASPGKPAEALVRFRGGELRAAATPERPVAKA